MSTIKRERNVNFTSEETELLLKLVNENKHIVENKKSDAATWQQKENCWKSIESSFNCANGVRYRSGKSLKMKYEAYKRDMKKKLLNVPSIVSKTEENSMSDPLLPLSEVNVKNLIICSVNSKDDSFDSDHGPQIGNNIHKKNILNEIV